MKTDLYVKVVLTIIAACLLMLSVHQLAPSASAQIAPSAGAPTSFKCSGELKAGANGGTAAQVGGYKVELACR